MLYDATTPSEYLHQLEKDWRKEKLLQLRELIMSEPDIEEGIKYSMLSYGNTSEVFMQLNAQKNYVALYVGDASKVDPSGELLEGINHGKGCLRFKISTSILDTRIDEFIAKAIDMWKRGEDIDC